MCKRRPPLDGGCCLGRLRDRVAMLQTLNLRLDRRQRMVRGLWLSLFASGGVVTVLVSAGAGQTLEEVLDANESAVGLVYRIDMVVDSYRESFNGKKFDPPILRSTWRWSKDGERQRHRSHSYDEKGNPSKFSDLLESGKEWRLLRNWDPQNPPDLLYPRDQEGVYASIEPRYPNMMFSVEALFTLMKIALEANDPRRTLREFVKTARSARLEGTARVGNHETLKVMVTDPACSTRDSCPDCTVAVYIDRGANFMIRKLERSWRAQSERGSKPSRTTYVVEVKRFKDFGEGVYLPEEVETRMLAPAFMAGPTVETRMVARDVVVNAPLPADALDFHFPENVVVRELVPGREKRILLWGPDDQPKKEIEKMDDLGPHRVAGSQPLVSRRGRFVGTLVGSAVLLAGLWFVIARWRRR